MSRTRQIPQQPVEIATLRRYIIDEIFIAMGAPANGWARRLLGPLFWLPAQKFASLAAQFDHSVQQCGLQSAVRQVLPRFVDGLEVCGAQNIPLEGPLLVVSNHPGAYDLGVIAANLPREDLEILVSGVPFVRRLPATSRHLIYVTAGPHQRISAVRASIQHLQDGGALLIYPSGRVDPDPEVLPGAHDALEHWSRSLELMIRKAPETQVLVTIVSGVLSPASLRNPLVRLPKEVWRQHKLAEFFQVMQQLLFPGSLSMIPRVSFGEPFKPGDLAGGQGDPSGILEWIIKQAHNQLFFHMSTDDVV
jgi:hypothetical protein